MLRNTHLKRKTKMANIPVNNSGQTLSASQAFSGSYSGFIACALSGSTMGSNFVDLKGGDGGFLVSASLLTFAPGTFVPITVVSGSLHGASAPVILFR